MKLLTVSALAIATAAGSVYAQEATNDTMENDTMQTMENDTMEATDSDTMETMENDTMEAMDSDTMEGETTMQSDTTMQAGDTMQSDSMGMAMSTQDLNGMQGNLIRSRDITGGYIYTMNQADDEGWDPEMTWDNMDSNWNQIGEIEDLVLSENGQIIGIVAEVGGFLDIGDKHVVISVQDLNLAAVDDQTYAYVTRMSEEELEELEGVDEAFWN